MPKKKEIPCKHCGSIVKDRHNKYCNSLCFSEFHLNKYIVAWLAGNIDGTTGDRVSQYIRRYLFKINNNSCELCGWNKINPATNKCPLEIHHIDGNHKNSKFENLQLLCPNCHALTINHGSLNTGKGRAYKKTRI